RLFDMSLYILDILPTTRSTLFPYTTLFRSIPREYGGDGWTGSRLLEGYEQLAGACLTSCFILSQRDGACRRIRDSGNAPLCQELLPPLARGERFATVGLSHLTTSRQHVQPALTAKIQGHT